MKKGSPIKVSDYRLSTWGFKADDNRLDIIILFDTITDKSISNNERFHALQSSVEYGYLPIFNILYNYCTSVYSGNDLKSELMRFRYIITNYFLRHMVGRDKFVASDSGEIASLSDAIYDALIFEYDFNDRIYVKFLESLWEVIQNYDKSKGGFISYILSFWKFNLIDRVVIPALKSYYYAVVLKRNHGIYYMDSEFVEENPRDIMPLIDGLIDQHYYIDTRYRKDKLHNILCQGIWGCSQGG